MIGNKIADKITSVGKTKSEEKKIKQGKVKKFRYHEIKDNKSLMTWDCFRHHIKMEYQKIINLLHTKSDNVFITFVFITNVLIMDRSSWSVW